MLVGRTRNDLNFQQYMFDEMPYFNGILCNH